jgi:cellulose synthase operon protein C
VILHFPTLDALKLALFSDAIPATVSVTPVMAAFAEKGGCWVETDKPITKPQLSELAKLGVSIEKAAPLPLAERLHCWPQLIPLQKEPLNHELTEKTPILFEVPSEIQFTDLVSEVLRLGNDRQSYRWLANGKQNIALLRVVGPPYYSLLRAVDQTQNSAAPKAYRELSPRVWVQLGFTHPLVNKLRPGPGKWLFLRPPRTWFMVDEAKFHDIYEVLDFQLPHVPSAWKEGSFEKKVQVPLRLTTSTSTEPAELWVLRDNAMSQLDDLVRSADEQLLTRLSFAVAQQGQESLIVLRVRPAKQAPPVLVLDGIAYRSFLRLPNLFVPAGYRLHPTLRRDAVVTLLASDTTRITWLHPEERGGFLPESLPDTAFRPLQDWVQYVLDHEQKPLEAWMQAARFDFEPFICKDDAAPVKDPLLKQEAAKTRKSKKEEEEETSPARKERSEQSAKPVEETYAALRLAKTPTEIAKKLRETEKQFLELSVPLDAPERRQLWHQMAHCNMALGHATDATVCWCHALWEGDQLPGDWWHGWRQSEARAAQDVQFSVEQLQKMLKQAHPPPSEMRAFAAFLAWVSHASPLPQLAPLLGPIQQYLEKHEELLPVRAVWLAWSSLAKLNKGDVLTLARARDRLLERLHLRGQSPEMDLPAFLRFTGAKATERLRGMKDHLLVLEGVILQWLDKRLAKWREKKQPLERAQHTEAYARLILAYGFACLGAAHEAQRLTQAAMHALAKTDDLNAWLTAAFQFRIERAMRDRGTAAPFPPELAKRLENYVPERGDKKKLDLLKLEKYKLNKFILTSSIIEPHERADVYHRWTEESASDDLSRELRSLVTVRDRPELIARLQGLLDGKRAWPKAENAAQRIHDRALELAPRLGAAFAGDLLSRTEPLLEQTKELKWQAQLLEKGLYLAAHFDQSGLVQRFVGRIQDLLTQQKDDAEFFKLMESVVEECLHGLRKLGMRDEIHRLLTQLSDLLQKRYDLIAGLTEGKASASLRSKPLQVQLHVAGGWLHFGHDDLAWPVIDQAREVLFKGSLIAADQTALACAYVRTLGQASLEEALPRLEELYRKVERIEDNTATRSHFLISMLWLIEATVLALVSDELTMDKDARRWLDDDEYLVRRRIHRDVRAAMQGAGL